jgi:hypothetical protein
MSPALPLLSQSAAHRRVLLASAALVLAVLNVGLFWSDLEVRRQAASLLSASGMASRESVRATLMVLESGDLAAAFAVETALSEMPPEDGGASAATRYGDVARPLLMKAIAVSAASLAARPGSPVDRMLLARAAYEAWELEASPSPARADAWQAAFQEAAAAAPGFDLVVVSAATANLAAWPRLSEKQRAGAVVVIRRALDSRDFVHRAFPRVWRLLGPSAAEMLPDRSEELADAAGGLRAMGELEAAQRLEDRRSRLGAP